jgi:hypothetical protein
VFTLLLYNLARAGWFISAKFYIKVLQGKKFEIPIVEISSLYIRPYRGTVHLFDRRLEFLSRPNDKVARHFMDTPPHSSPNCQLDNR